MTKVTDPLGRSTVTAATPAEACFGHGHGQPHDVIHLRFARAPATTTYADQTTETDDYDVLGRRKTHTDQMSSPTQYGYDAEGQLTAVTDALMNVTQYGYDLSGNLTGVTGRRTITRRRTCTTT